MNAPTRTRIFVEPPWDYSNGRVLLTYRPKEEAVQLFHDLNRVLGLVEETTGDLAPGDLDAVRRLSELAEDLQRSLQIEPEGT